MNGSGPELYAAAAAAREVGDWPRVVELCARLMASGAPSAEAVALMREARDALRQRRAATPEDPGAPETEAPAPPAEAISPVPAEPSGLAEATPAPDVGTLSAEIRAQAEARLAEAQARLADLRAQLEAVARAEAAPAARGEPPSEALASPQPAALAQPEPPAEALAAPQPAPPDEPPVEALTSPQPAPEPGARTEPPAEALAAPPPVPPAEALAASVEAEPAPAEALATPEPAELAQLELPPVEALAPPPPAPAAHPPDEVGASPTVRPSPDANAVGPSETGAQQEGTFEARDDVTILSPQGDLDAATIDKFQAQIEQVFSAGARKFVIDFGGVTFLDSSGLWALVRLYGRLRDGGGGARLARVSPGVMRIFELTRLTEYFDIRPSVEEALASLQ